MSKICPFRYAFNSGAIVHSCDRGDCRAWDTDLETCVLLLPFKELAKEIRDEQDKDR